mmetsp:Transcript_28201/g.46710  ORF Transcript_28201/g.46710 Transcript_28201/m.46710 type:complete len:132 (+) Transcript_28201:183-578(+)|eukprot:CAMPEP_0119004296 /NCGR_PEP_ID=MMETSP1176-20130426/1062_1 /TAXON_ID=265551 /ORGANISM="Synedropsis recta cf, Strain CCMP1620" /LENGTH=131 /DNA_ID=CAMNT_0006955983 /DNA_START=138 /DNA_END=533 /DNA_ORIENTATION=-
MTMMRNMMLAGLFATTANAFTTPAFVRPSTTTTTTSARLSMSKVPLEEGENPCWQDLYDDDCSMESVYAANFVAAKWIKGMPCAAGIEDCDMPEPLQVPGVKEDGVAEVDVMDFLGLKRVHLGTDDDELTP